MNGLTNQEVEERINNNLMNKKVKYSKSVIDIIKNNIFTLFNFINIALFVLVLTTKSYKNGLFVFVIIINTIIAIYGEIKAKIAIDKLNITSNSFQTVIRNGKYEEIKEDKLVLDDVIVLKNGAVAPVDCCIINSNLCEVDESIITGETKNIIKKKDDIIYSGSIVISGSCRATVINIGNKNYTNALLKEANHIKDNETYLTKELNKVLKIVTMLIIPMMILLFITQYFINKVGYNSSILYTTAGVIGMIPSGLILLTSIALSTGVIRMAKKKVIVEKISGIETLACVDILCLDKTGTITDGTLEVIDFINKSQFDLNIIIKNMLDNELINQTDIALNNYFSNNNTEKLQIIKKVPFSSYRKYSMVSFENLGTFGLGALEYMFEKIPKYEQKIQQYVDLGYRILTLVYSKKYSDTQKLPSDIKVIAYIILKDNIRKNIAETLNYFTTQDVKLKIISGDNINTISNIMKQVGYVEYNNCLDCSKLSDEELIKETNNYSIFGRCNPYQKRLIIKKLKDTNTVGMVGDGVNDILALKEADCSIAISNNTASAKSVAQIVLLENDFTLLPEIVNEGRRVINNITRVASLYLVKTIYSFILSFSSILLTTKYPFLPIQLTLIGSICVALPSLALTYLKDNTKIKKNFIKDVFKIATTSGITVCINIFIIYMLSIVLKTNIDNLKIIIIALTGAINLLILYKISNPINKIKKIILVVTLLLFIIAITIFKDMFVLNSLNFNNILAIILLFITDILIIKSLEKLYEKIILYKKYDKIK